MVPRRVGREKCAGWQFKLFRAKSLAVGNGNIGNGNMKLNRLIPIAFTLCCALLLPIGCQQQAKTADEPGPGSPALPEESPAEATKANKPAPKITFESLEYNFGTVGPRVKKVGEFKFTNIGDAPLRITNVDRCCGVVARLDKTVYAPGESGVLKVEYRSSSLASTMKRRLYVNNNDATNSRVTLTIQAKVELRVTWEPKRLKLLLKDENVGCPKITLKSTKNDPFSVTSFTSTGDSITADIDRSVEATEIVLQPKVDMEKLQKSRTGRISIGLTYSQPDTPSETVSIIFQALSRFSVTPSMLVALYGDSREPTKKSLWITNNYGENFEVESTSSKEGHIKVLSQRKVGGRYQFVLEITPPPGEDVKRFADTFTINLKDDEPLEINCRGIYSTRLTKTKPST